MPILVRRVTFSVIFFALAFFVNQADANSGSSVFSQSGIASFYADKYVGRKTANGEIYQHDLATAAHRTLRFGTKVKVTNAANGKSVIVTINDRGPFVKGRIIDLSKSTFSLIAEPSKGIVNVEIEVIK